MIAKKILILSLLLTFSSLTWAAGITRNDDEAPKSVPTAQPSQEASEDLLERIRKLEEENANLKASASQTTKKESSQEEQEKTWYPVEKCPEEGDFNRLGNTFRITNETNTYGHKKVIGDNGAQGYLDSDTLPNGTQPGVYTMNSDGSRFYLKGNCNYFPDQEGPGALQDKWIGGSLHKAHKYINTANMSGGEKTLKSLFGF